MTKKSVILTLLSSFCASLGMLSAQVVVLPLDGSGSIQTADPFGTETLLPNSWNPTGNQLGWKNGMQNEVFKQILQFDISGEQAAFQEADQVVLDLTGLAFGGATSLSLYSLAPTNTNVTGFAAGFGDGAFFGANFGQTVGTAVSTSILPANGSSQSFDITAIIENYTLAGSTYLVFRLQAEIPTSNPGSSPLAFPSLSGSTLTAIPEPSTYAALAGLAALLLVLRRRLRR